MSFAIYLALAASSCRGSVSIEGPRAMVEQVEQRIRSAKISSCRKLKATLVEGQGGLEVLLEVDGMTVERAASTPEIAAVVIESWAAADGPRHVVHAPEVPAPREVEPVVAAAPDEARGSRFRLRTDASLSIGSDASVWVGPFSEVCMKVGWACGGLALRYGRAEVDNGDLFQLVGRFGAGLRISRWTLGGHLGVGVGAISRDTYRPYYGPCERFECNGPTLRKSGVGPIFAAGVDTTFHASRWLGVELELSGSTEPILRERTAGTAVWFFHVGLGLRVDV